MVPEQTSQRGALDRSAVVLLSKSEEVAASRDSLKTALRIPGIPADRTGFLH